MKRAAIYPGTFDPITNGHLDIIERALRIVDTLIVGIAKDTTKSTIFSFEKRSELVEKSVECLENIDKERVKVIPFKGLLTEFAKKQGAVIIIRGLRAVSDFDYEFQMSGMNNKLDPNIETIFLPSIESSQYISSSFLREVARLKGDISPFVSKCVADEIKKFYKY
ncbi:pantetheine-phosphate adenylyltransferase [Pseudomonadota bacterium]